MDRPNQCEHDWRDVTTDADRQAGYAKAEYCPLCGANKWTWAVPPEFVKPGKDCCASCRFWNVRIAADPLIAALGECLRHAPAHDPRTDGVIEVRANARWPVTEGDRWCGDFRPAGSPEPLADQIASVPSANYHPPVISTDRDAQEMPDGPDY